MVNILARYTPRPASERERLATIADNERTDGCSSCARLQFAGGLPRWEPASRMVLMADGERRPLCAWCREWFRIVGVLPTVTELDLHHRGVRVRRPAFTEGA